MWWCYLRFLSNMCILGYRKLILSMFNGDLQRKPPETLVSVNRRKRKPPYDISFWAAIRPGEFGEICCKEEFVFEVVLGLLSANHRAGSYQTKTPREGWHHSESLQWVSWPQVVLFVSSGGFSVIFCVERNDALPPMKRFALGCWSQAYHSEANPTK